MRDNPFEESVTNLVDGMKAQAKSLSSYSKDVKPYRSVELSPEEERRVFVEPWRLFPGEDSMIQPGLGRLTEPEARAKALVQMGPVKYVKWWDDNVGR